jgi:hypothetical protein
MLVPGAEHYHATPGLAGSVENFLKARALIRALVGDQPCVVAQKQFAAVVVPGTFVKSACWQLYCASRPSSRKVADTGAGAGRWRRSVSDAGRASPSAPGTS